MPLLLPLLPLIAQVGPFSAPKTVDPFSERRPRPAATAPVTPPLPAPVTSPAMRACDTAVESNPDAALAMAQEWQAKAKGPARAEAQMCLGLAQSGVQNWGAAEQAFLAGREDAGNRLLRARLGAMAGSAALAGAAPDRALAALDIAASDAKGLVSPALESGIAIDRARALVALNRGAEAELALTAARAATPDNAEAWLLSATLARHRGDLAGAQARIEKAAALLPVDPEIGLEAGVIAVLSGHPQTARKSWQSVVAAAPDSIAAQTATGYLAQLGPTQPVPAKASRP